MDRRKDTAFNGTPLPREYLNMVRDVFDKNFKSALSQNEHFVVFGEIFPDEMVLVVSMNRPGSLGMTTCYASIDYPAPGSPKNVSEQVQYAVNLCVDGVASFFATFFEENRPVDYDTEYRQSWTLVELEKGKKVFLRINRDNLELDAQADAILELDTQKKNKKKLN